MIKNIREQADNLVKLYEIYISEGGEKTFLAFLYQYLEQGSNSNGKVGEGRIL